VKNGLHADIRYYLLIGYITQYVCHS